MGYERLRSNQGFYLHNSNYPFAELFINLRYNSLTSMYTFEDTARQFHSHYHYTEDFNSVFNNVDFSLRAQFPFIKGADDKAYFNYRTNIYLEALDTVYFSNTTAESDTEAEKIYLSDNEGFIRYSYQGLAILEGTVKVEVQYSSKPYYRWFDNLVYNYEITECLPPYTNVKERFEAEGGTACPNLVEYYKYFSQSELNIPPILQCFTGIAPYKCPTLETHDKKMETFLGYPFTTTELCNAFT